MGFLYFIDRHAHDLRVGKLFRKNEVIEAPFVSCVYDVLFFVVLTYL